MTRRELLDLLEKEAKRYRLRATASIKHNKHMNNLSSKDFAKLELGIEQQLMQKIIDALLVDFINYVGDGQNINYGLRTKHLQEKERAKMVLHHDHLSCTARLTSGGLCPECSFVPDMQSTCFYFYCPNCDCLLKNLKCPKCKQTLQHPRP